MKKHILVVCTGNICRTPMVKALLGQALDEAGLADQVVVDSAGTYAAQGGSASDGSVQAMAARELDIAEHRGKQLTLQHVEKADIILVMAEQHRRSIFLTWPQALTKTFLLNEMAGDYGDIADPYRMPQAEYDKAAEIIEDYVRRGLPQIMRRLGLFVGDSAQKNGQSRANLPISKP